MHNCLLPGLSSPAVFGHRGYSAAAPENTFSAFQACRDHGVPAIELDIHLCASGELVVFHDHDTQRITGTSGTIELMSLRELKKLDAGSWFSPSFKGEKIPTLEEVFTVFGNNFFYNIEMKSRRKDDFGLAMKTCRLIEKHSLTRQCIVSSFNPLQVRYVERHRLTNIATAVIFADDPEVPKLLRHGLGRILVKGMMLQVEYAQITKRWFRKFHDTKGYRVIGWTMDDPGIIRKALDLGVEGIISNDPLQTLELVRDYSAPRQRQVPRNA